MSSFHDIEKYKIQPELKLILLLLRIDNGDHVTGEINSLSGSNFDWNRFLFYVRWHRLGNFVHSALEKYPDPVPPEIAERLKNETEKGKFRIMKLSQELVLLTKIFQQKEIDIISVKGPLLSKRIFGDMCMRPSRDLDLLIPPDEIETAGKILESAGYRMINPKHKPSGRFMDYFVKHYSDFEYLHPEHNIIVELHWKLFNNSYLYPSGFSDLSGRAITDRFGGTEIKVLSDEDALLHLFLHGTWHNWMRLFWLYDIVGIVSGGLPVDWDGFVNRAKRSGTARSVAGGLELAAVLFGTDV
ncbi:nucleotidyltransferase family protein, partial [Patescibacteria group bacterium]|nr:nucleotidyltransferase family protein [Patescibacteria group bacterium]